MVAAMFREVDVELESPVPRMDYADAMERFGTDRPDTRFALELRDAGPATLDSGFKVFQGAIDAGGVVRGLAVPGGAAASRKRIDESSRGRHHLITKRIVSSKHDSAATASTGTLKRTPCNVKRSPGCSATSVLGLAQGDFLGQFLRGSIRGLRMAGRWSK